MVTFLLVVFVVGVVVSKAGQAMANNPEQSARIGKTLFGLFRR